MVPLSRTVGDVFRAVIAKDPDSVPSEFWISTTSPGAKSVSRGVGGVAGDFVFGAEFGGVWRVGIAPIPAGQRCPGISPCTHRFTREWGAQRDHRLEAKLHRCNWREGVV